MLRNFVTTLYIYTSNYASLRTPNTLNVFLAATRLISCRKRATSKTRFVFTSASQKFQFLYRVAYRGLTSVATIFSFGRVSFLTARSAYRSIRGARDTRRKMSVRKAAPTFWHRVLLSVSCSIVSLSLFFSALPFPLLFTLPILY